MTYPEELYRGDGGEKTAWHRAADSEPDWVYPNGNTVHYLATGKSSNGLLGLYRWNMGPEPTGPGPHFHRTISESFYILTGNVKIYNGDEWINTEPGDYVHVPPGGIHGFRNESGAPASMLILFTPGAPREAYFEGLVNVSQMSREEKAEFFAYHDNHWLDD